MLQHFIDDFFDCAAQQLPLLISTEWMEEPIGKLIPNIGKP